MTTSPAPPTKTVTTQKQNNLRPNPAQILASSAGDSAFLGHCHARRLRARRLRSVLDVDTLHLFTDELLINLWPRHGLQLFEARNICDRITRSCKAFVGFVLLSAARKSIAQMERLACKNSFDGNFESHVLGRLC